VSHSLIPAFFRPPLDIPDIPYDHLLRQTAERFPDRPAIIFQNLTLTYREVVSLVNSTASGLLRLGLGKGDHLCVFIANCIEYPILFNAAATIGAVLCPINPVYKEGEVSYQLADSEAKAIVVQSVRLPLLQAVLREGTFPHLRHIIVTEDRLSTEEPDTISFDALLRESPPKRPAPIRIDGDDILALPYSSGTTGLPKGVMLTHRNLVSNHLQFLTASRISEADTVLIFLPLYHIYGILLTAGLLVAGATQVIMERFDLAQSLDLCERYGVTWFPAVPPILQALTTLPADVLDQKMKNVKYIMSAAAPLPQKVAQGIQDRLGVPIIQGYGLTESSPDSHLTPVDPQLSRTGSVGLPVHNTEQKVVDQETGERELPSGEDGEIIIRGPQVMRGYWKAPEETARALRNGWLYTGDIGHVDTDGYLYIVDRKKEMIKYKGFSVAPAELEAVLLEHPAVLDAAVIGVSDDKAGELPKGFVVLRPEQTITAEELILFANEKVAGYKKLHTIEFIEVLPRVPSGKILRRVLKERERAAR
jgi:long-chain acyl-CoA synthetase